MPRRWQHIPDSREMHSINDQAAFSDGGERVMELNRNQYLMAGLVVLMLGIQMRLVETFVLNEHATQFLAQRIQQIKGQQIASASDMRTLYASQGPIAQKPLSPPDWLGFSLVSVGSVLVLYSLALKKPGG
jgi:hypothetical protein